MPTVAEQLPKSPTHVYKLHLHILPSPKLRVISPFLCNSHQDFGKLYFDKVTWEAEAKKNKTIEVRQLYYEFYKQEIQTIPKPRLLQINNTADLDI